MTWVSSFNYKSRLSEFDFEGDIPLTMNMKKKSLVFFVVVARIQT